MMTVSDRFSLLEASVAITAGGGRTIGSKGRIAEASADRARQPAETRRHREAHPASAQPPAGTPRGLGGLLAACCVTGHAIRFLRPLPSPVFEPAGDLRTAVLRVRCGHEACLAVAHAHVECADGSAR